MKTILFSVNNSPNLVPLKIVTPNRILDVLVMDISMPGIDGLEASRKILARDKSAKILIFSVYENEVYLTLALDLGVLGYISKHI